MGRTVRHAGDLSGVNCYASLEAMRAAVWRAFAFEVCLAMDEGRPDPSLPVEWLGGEAGTFRQLGWMVRLDRWAEGLLQAERDQAGSSSLKGEAGRAPNR